uniref:Uncharacterized protein n=1 Tax=Minutocellus polymorphus TaxID=265543 RepID=A0A7S0FHK0_9STRA|mmetsp:Transcript_10530/g.17449  ORF Transcript_10530/g.17449 Transcript_10530/m.17449 type:complete len:137 (+) Transcript_10530:129-539(+)
MRNVSSIFVLCSALLAVASGFTAPVSITADVQAIAVPSSIVSAPHQQLLNDGINAWSASSSSVVLSDESSEDIVAKIAAKSAAANEAARAKAEKNKKSAEQLADEKKTFAWYFWGGGFVAPFLATFYYFGFKFWEK